MKLYEVTNGFIGESYVHLYAWAETPDRALELARASFRAESDSRTDPYEETYWTNLAVRELFDGNAVPFATPPTDDGWPEDGR